MSSFCLKWKRSVQVPHLDMGMKEKTRAAMGAPEAYGDAYTFVAIERTSKLIVAWHLGKGSHFFDNSSSTAISDPLR